MKINTWFDKNYDSIENMAKILLKERFREGISEYYIHLVEKNKVPTSKYHAYWYMKNLTQKNSKLNYQPIVLRGDLEGIEIGDSSEELKNDLRMDLKDERLVDFMINNDNNERWMKIYDIIYTKGIKMNLFEEILFEYVFIEGLSIAKIREITGNSQSFIYKMRKELIEKIKKEL